MMDFLALLLLSLLCISILFIILKHITTRKTRPQFPPGPKGLPLIGNLHQIDTKSPHIYLTQLSKQYGPILSLNLGFVPTIVISSSKLAKEVLKTQDTKFASRPQLLGIRKLSYNGLDIGFAPFSPYWREMKKLCILHLFSPQRVQSFRPIREQEVSQLVMKISENENSGEVINLTEKLMCFTNNLICRVAFGKKYGHDYYNLDNEGFKLQSLLNEAQEVMTKFYFSDHFPMMGWIDWLRGILWRLANVFMELDMIYERVIHDHMDSSSGRSKKVDDAGGDAREEVADIIDIFLRMMHEHSFSFDLTLEHIKAVLMNIFIAGTDTIAATTVWAMNALLKNPKAMQKLQTEIRNLYGDKDFINEDEIQNLPYLKAVVKETLRLFPPSPLLLPRETAEKCTIEGYEIKPKTLVYVNAWAIARDPENFEDPDEFFPERFINNGSDEFKGNDYNYNNNNDFVFIPFGAGKRTCPAMQMGLVTVELTVANLVNKFDWDLPLGIVNKEEMLGTQVKPGITMHKKNDLHLVAKKHTK